MVVGIKNDELGDHIAHTKIEQNLWVVEGYFLRNLRTRIRTKYHEI